MCRGCGLTGYFTAQELATHREACCIPIMNALHGPEAELRARVAWFRRMRRDMENTKVVARRAARIALVLQLNLADAAWAQVEAVVGVNNPHVEAAAAEAMAALVLQLNELDAAQASVEANNP